MYEEFVVPWGDGPPLIARQFSPEGPSSSCLVLAHGAGAGQRSPFMTAFAEAMRIRGVTAVTFDFPYMQQRRRVPDRAPVLERAWRAVAAHVRSTLAGPARLVIGGKSMGGRMASHVLGDAADRLDGIDGLVLLGYPLHPPGQPDRLRDAHLPAVQTPTLVVQGARDTFGTEDEVRRAFAKASAPVDWLIVPGGDHSFKVPRSGGKSQADVLRGVHDTVAAWVLARTARPTSVTRPLKKSARMPD
jgi:predicted alpha/beta-hydrolase family hydrolase